MALSCCITPTSSASTNDSRRYETGRKLSVSTHPVIFSKYLRAPSVIFSFKALCLTGSIFPPPNFFSAASRPD